MAFLFERGQNHFRLWTLLGAVIASLVGCSLFSSKSDIPASGNFHATVSPSENLVPVPVEVASDISRIVAGKPIYNAPTIFSKESSSQLNQRDPSSEAASDFADEDEPDVQRKTSKSGNSIYIHHGGKVVKYKVRRGDTLMKIAFEKYANVYRWREIYNQNKKLIKSYNHVPPGTVLTIAGVEYVVIEKNGEPYLIRKADTLIKISKTIYGTPTEWKNLWNNNRQLIHNPNKIYAGFTLYHQPIGTATPRVPAEAKKRHIPKKASSPIEMKVQAPVGKPTQLPTKLFEKSTSQLAEPGVTQDPSDPKQTQSQAN